MFYKLDGGELLVGNTVIAPEFTLTIETKDSYSYPMDGWYWFESETQAREFFNLVSEVLV